MWSNPKKYIHNTKHIYGTQLCSSTVVHRRVGSGAAAPKNHLNYMTAYHRICLAGLWVSCIGEIPGSSNCVCQWGR